MYKIKKNHERLAVYKDGVIETNGFLREEDALHSIWIINGAIPHHFYNVDIMGCVSLEIKE